MTGVGDTPRDFEEFTRDVRRRITALERRQVLRTDLSTLITAGDSIIVTGEGTVDDPIVVASQYGVFDGGYIAHSLGPSDFSVGYWVGISDSSYPNGETGVVEVVVGASGVRAVQRVTYKGDRALAGTAGAPDTSVSETYQRSPTGGGSSWGPWIRTAGDSGWVNLTAYFPGWTEVYGRRVNRSVELMGGGSASVASGSSVDITGTALPAPWRPSGRSRWGTYYANGQPGMVFVRVDGTVALRQNTGSAVTSGHQFSIVYTV